MQLDFDNLTSPERQAVLEIITTAVEEVAGRPVVVRWDSHTATFQAYADGQRLTTEPVQEAIRRAIRRALRRVAMERSRRWLNLEEGQLVSGVIDSVHGKDVFVDLGGLDALLPQGEQIPGEQYEPGNPIRAYVHAISYSAQGDLQVRLSRAHPHFLRLLLARIVPEVADGTVQIVAVARAPGERAKVAVTSEAPGIDPVGACVGAGGSRVDMLRQELAGERVDIVRWASDPAVYIRHALAPVEVHRIHLDPLRRQAHVEVTPENLPVAIGTRGQNVRLASRLTGWRLVIVPVGRVNIPEPGWLDAVLQLGAKEGTD